jgi:hypothetical protein
MAYTHNPTPEEQNMAVLCTLLSAYHFTDCLDRICNTNYYRHKVKLLTRQLIPELSNFIKPLDAMFEMNEESAVSSTDAQIELIKLIAAMRPDEKLAFTAVLQKFKENPDKVMELLEIQFVHV